MQNDLENIYMKKSIALFEIDPTKLPIVKLSNVMPFLNPVLIIIGRSLIAITAALRKLVPSLMRNVQGLPTTWIIEQVGQVVEERLRSGKRRMDLLQLMLDAAKQDEVTVGLLKFFSLLFLLSIPPNSYSFR
jgi:hypothetical protein